MTSDKQQKHWWLIPAKPVDQVMYRQARAYQNTLTKPPGSLGALENIALSFAAWQGVLKPELKKIQVRVFAADHGVCVQGVSAFPQVVTAQMVQNFVAGGAAISVLSRALNADFSVVNLGTVQPIGDSEGIEQSIVGPGTADFSQQAAMSEAQCETALAIGKNACADSDLFIGGEMGIGNTTSASAILCALLDLPPEDIVGPGTGVDAEGLSRKISVVKKALNVHRAQLQNPLTVLQYLGGFEIVALTGAYIANAQNGVPNLIDGFISTAAALVAVRINPSVADWCMLSHISAEPGHKKILSHFNTVPLLDIGMRLGEGSGAAVTVPIIQAALKLHAQMATFRQAKVSEQQ